jgi:hypothetical protein
VLHALQGDHLGDEEVERVRLDARAVLQGTGEALRERRAGLGGAVRAGFDLGIDVALDFLEDDVDLGAPLVAERAPRAQILPALLAEAHLGEHNRLDGAGIGRAARVVGFAFGVGACVAERALVFGGLGGRLAGIGAALWRVLLHEHCDQHLHQHQQRLDQRAALRPDLAVGGELPETPFERRELLAQGLLVEARHARQPGGLLAGLDAEHRGQHRQALPRGQGSIAP